MKKVVDDILKFITLEYIYLLTFIISIIMLSIIFFTITHVGKNHIPPLELLIHDLTQTNFTL